MMSGRSFAVLAVAAAMALAGPRFAQGQSAEVQTGMQLRVGAVHTDNLGRDEALRERRTFGFAGADLDARHETRRLAASARGSLDYYHYESERFRNELVGSVAAAAQLTLIERRLFWSAENRFGQVRSDPLRSIGPGNRRNVNIFSTGPDLMLPLSARTQTQAGARWSSRRYSGSGGFDSEQYSGSVELVRVLSPTQTGALGATAWRTEYDIPETPHVDIHTAYARYDRRLASGRIGLRAGVSSTRRAGRTDSGWIADLDWLRDLTARSTLSFNAGRDRLEAGEQFRLSPLERDLLGALDDVLWGPEPLTRTRASLGYGRSHSRSRFNAHIGWADERRDNVSGLDREVRHVGAGYRYDIRPDLSLALDIRYREEDLRRTGARADEVLTNAVLGWQVGRQVGLRASHSYRTRSGRGTGWTYRENRWGVTLTWVPGGR